MVILRFFLVDVNYLPWPWKWIEFRWSYLYSNIWILEWSL